MSLKALSESIRLLVKIFLLNFPIIDELLAHKYLSVSVVVGGPF